MLTFRMFHLTTGSPFFNFDIDELLLLTTAATAPGETNAARVRNMTRFAAAGQITGKLKKVKIYSRYWME